jgi:predicted nucleic acid-binding protein
MIRTTPVTLDSNLLIYAADPDDPERQSSAIEMI